MIHRLGFCALAVLFNTAIAPAAPPKVTRMTLGNGVRVLILHYADSTQCAMFSLLPLGLAADGADRTQWSHLVEHLTLRTTGPITDYRERNAETMPSGMHLDWMGSADRWQDGLTLQAKWLSGSPFEERIFREEIPKAISEMTTTVPQGFTHKWALAAWNQVVRHGRDRVAMRGAIEHAALPDVAAYRDEHLVILDRVMFCVVSGLPAETLRPLLTEQIGALQSKAKSLPAPSVKEFRPGERRAKWDLPARHLVVSWPIPAPGSADFAALHLAAQALSMQFASDPTIQSLGAKVFASTDTVSPETTSFVVSAPVRVEKDSNVLRDRIDHHIATLRAGSLPTVPMLAQALSSQLSPEALDTAAMRKQGVPAQVTDAMLEANIGLQRALFEWRNPDLDAFAAQLKSLTAAKVADAVRRQLSDERRATLLLEPGDN